MQTYGKRPIKSTDPRKPKIMYLLKELTKATKVTQVCEIFTEDGILYQGECFKSVGRKKYEKIGTFSISQKYFEHGGFLWIEVKG